MKFSLILTEAIREAYIDDIRYCEDKIIELETEYQSITRVEPPKTSFCKIVCCGFSFAKSNKL